MPGQAAHIQQVLAIPGKRYTRRLVNFLTRPEADALLGAPDLATPLGRRDHALILLALQTGLRLSELVSLSKEDVSLQTGAHVRVIGKGRKERCTPLAKRTVKVLKAWFKERWCSKNGEKLSADGVQYIIAKHAKATRMTCPSLARKRVTPHVLRHTAAMELLQAGVDRTVIALRLGHESIGDHPSLPGCGPSHERKGAGQTRTNGQENHVATKRTMHCWTFSSRCN